MSNKVYCNILIPIIKKILASDPVFGEMFREAGYHQIVVDDPSLEKYILEEMNKRLGINGKVTTDCYGNVLEEEYCRALEITLLEMVEQHPEKLEEILREILNIYIKIGLQLDPEVQKEIKKHLEKREKRVSGFDKLDSPYFKKREERRNKKGKKIVYVR